MADSTQTITVDVDVSGLEVVMALGRAARDVVDHAEPVAPDERKQLVDTAELRKLAKALEPLLPGTDV